MVGANDRVARDQAREGGRIVRAAKGRGIEAWIGEAVAVNAKGGHMVGVVAAVDAIGLTLERAGRRDSTVRATTFVPWRSVADVVLASTLPARDDIDPKKQTNRTKETPK